MHGEILLCDGGPSSWEAIEGGRNSRTERLLKRQPGLKRSTSIVKEPITCYVVLDFFERRGEVGVVETCDAARSSRGLVNVSFPSIKRKAWGISSWSRLEERNETWAGKRCAARARCVAVAKWKGKAQRQHFEPP